MPQVSGWQLQHCDRRCLYLQTSSSNIPVKTMVAESRKPKCEGSRRLLSYLSLCFLYYDFLLMTSVLHPKCIWGGILTVNESNSLRRAGGQPAGMKEQQPRADQMPFLFFRLVLKGWSQNIQNIQSVLITTPLACIGHLVVLKAVFGHEANAS